MAISRRPKHDISAAFIEKGQDGGGKRWIRGSKTQITVTIAPELLKRIDAVARRDSLSRSALFTVWANEALRREEAA
jgi:hypothetical protein